MSTIRRLALGVVAVVAAAGTVLSAATAAHAAVPVTGGGSSFAQIEIDDWTGETARAPFNLKVSYSPSGSTFGRTGYLNGSLDFGASDIPFQPNEQANVAASGARKNFVYVPVSAGGLGLMYNLIDPTTGAQITTLKLSRHAACRIFTEETDLYWDDPEFASTNLDLSLPHQLVRTIVRSDGSGTSFVFSAFCIAVAKPLWDAFVAAEVSKNAQDDPNFLNGLPTSNWPQQFAHSNGGFGANGVASLVVDTPGAVTYNEAGFARAKNFPNAYLENGVAGTYVVPTDINVTRALSYATARPDGTFDLKYSANDPNAYFPSTYSYVIAQTIGFDPAKGEALARFLCYAVTKGQRRDLIVSQDYAPLSQPLVDIAHAAIVQIPGAPPWEQCAVASDPPPTLPPTTTKAATTTTTAKPGATTTTKPGATTTTKPGATTTTKPGAAPAPGTTKAGTVTAKPGTATTKPGTAATTLGVAVTAAGGAPVTAADGSQVTAAGPQVIQGDSSACDTTVPTSVAPTSTAADTSVAMSDQTATSAVGGIAATTTTVAPCAAVPADPSIQVLVAVPGDASGQQATPNAASPVAAAQVSAKKAGPTVAASAKVGIDGQQVTWVLLQGAGVCGLGVLLAGLSRKSLSG